MKSVMLPNFATQPSVKNSRTLFKQDFGHKTTMNSGYLVPHFIDIAHPGDTLSLQHSIFGRLATPLKPIMDNLKLSTFYVSVPIRLIWTNFPKFMGEQDTPGASVEYVTPKMTPPTAGYAIHSIFDYFGLPTGVTAANMALTPHHSLFARAYNLTYQELFRDENLQAAVHIQKDDGPDLATNYGLYRRGKRKDYITSCLPWPQKGPDVYLPIGNSAPVYGTEEGLKFRHIQGSSTTTIQGLTRSSSGSYGYIPDNNASGDVGATASGSSLSSDYARMVGYIRKGDMGTNMANSGLYADLDSATASTINEIREAFAMQRFFEIWAQNGSRYEEFLIGMFGVVSPDYRVMQPEYLGGSIHNITVNAVQQTSATESATPQGNLAAFSYVNAQEGGFRKSFTEHCIVMGFTCVDADLTYQHNMQKIHTLDTLFDFPFPTFQNLGEEPVFNREIFFKGNAADQDVFGYQQRYAYFRHRMSQITGKFRSRETDSLDAYHLSQEFDDHPPLSSTFIESTPPLNRCIAVSERLQPQLLVDYYFNYNVIRQLNPQPRTGGNL